jgi:GT2 family glycosyltransferase
MTSGLKVSVIIAAHARPIQLELLVNSLASQLSGGRRELIIAENGTLAPTRLPSERAVTARVHDIAPGKCRVQNRAIGLSHGEILVFLDDDLIVSPRYITEVESFFDSGLGFAAMKGRILPAEDPIAKVGRDWPYLDLPLVDHGERAIEVRGVLGANMAFRARALAKVGRFDERLGPGACGHEEETEMSSRLRRAGFRIGYSPKAIVYHEVDPSRAERNRFIRIARERGRCRVIHERHSLWSVAMQLGIARARLRFASLNPTRIDRIAREERRVATLEGMRDGLRHLCVHQ